ncbi:MAG: molybdopterin biosynthesis protein [Fervidicoccaceae archaeon]
MSTERKLFHVLMSPGEALEALRREGVLSPLGTEKVNIEESLHRVIATDIYSPIDYPPFDRSEVDGYAVSIRSVEGADELHPIRLKIKGYQKIGESPVGEVGLGEAIGIDTGAVIPRGATGVVMEEHTVKVGNSTIEVRKSVSPGENIAFAGSDIARGELIVPRGTMLTPEKIAVLSSLGIKEIEVYKIPKISVLSTGNEIVSPGDNLPVGKIYESNGRMILSFLASLGIGANFAGVVEDSYERMKERLEELIRKSDIVITSGGTSAGEEDVVYRVFQDIGKIVVHGLRMKPGKPTVIAVSGRKLMIGLPGFPLSALTNLILLVKPILMEIMGSSSRQAPLTAAFTGRLRKGLGRTWIVPVMLNNLEGIIHAVPIPSQSGSVSSLMRTDAIAILPEESEIIEDGELVKVIPIRQEFPPWREALLVGSHDLLLQDYLRALSLNERIGAAFTGSFRGLNLLKRGVIDIAPIHLLDEKSNTYNAPFIKSDDLLSKMAFLIRGYKRRLVLAFRGENEVESLEDAMEKGLRFVNRNIGSGTRTFIDLTLKQIAAKRNATLEEVKKKLKGYEHEAPNHNAVAAAISQGRADVGICIEHAAALYGLNYRAVAEEQYDFAILRKSLNKEAVSRFVDGLKDGSIGKIAEKYIGYIVDGSAGTVVCC